MNPMSDEAFEAHYNYLLAKIKTHGLDKEKAMHDALKDAYRLIKVRSVQNHRRDAILYIGYILVFVAFGISTAGNYISDTNIGYISGGVLLSLLIVALSEVMSRWL